MKKFINENLYDFYHQSLLIKNTIFSYNSIFQKIDIIENSFFGRVLMLDNIVQTTEADEYFYHEMFVHVPLFAHENPKNVLIIGGGDGGILREAIKHKNIEKVTMVEIDKDVVNACSLHMPKLNDGAFASKKANVIIGDGVEFVKNTNEKFDVILIDSTDPISVGEGLFTREFYQNVKKCLNDNGILVTQSGVPFYQIDELISIKNKLKDIFTISTFFSVAVPTYVGGIMCLSFSTNKDYNLKPNLESLNNRFIHGNIGNLKYYNVDIHLASFALPQYIKNIF